MENKERPDILTIILDTGGGLVDSVERTVGIIRQHYRQVDFIIPDKAMSAGTVFALSGVTYLGIAIPSWVPLIRSFTLMINGYWDWVIWRNITSQTKSPKMAH